MFLIFCSMAFASSYLSVFLEPAAPRTPPFCEAPGEMMSMFEPRLAMELVTFERTPMPTETSAMTAATPMMMPSMVSRLRILFA